MAPFGLIDDLITGSFFGWAWTDPYGELVSLGPHWAEQVIGLRRLCAPGA